MPSFSIFSALSENFPKNQTARNASTRRMRNVASSYQGSVATPTGHVSSKMANTYIIVTVLAAFSGSELLCIPLLDGKFFPEKGTLLTFRFFVSFFSKTRQRSSTWFEFLCWRVTSMGSFFSRALLMSFGYAYPAYECFKSVEKKDPEIIQLLFWCHYWTIVALLTVLEKVGDPMFSWMPLYNEAKLAFFVYLWYPKTRGTEYVYISFLKPFLMNHEKEIDQNLMELKLRTRNVALFYSQKVVIHGRNTFFDILQYFSLQSKLQTQTDQPNHKQFKSASSNPSFSQKEHEPGGEGMVADGKESAETGSEEEEKMTAAVSPSSSRLCRRRSLLPFFSKLLGRNRGNVTSD